MLFLIVYLLLKSPWWSFRSTDTMSLPNKPMWPLITPFREVPQVNKSLECSRHDDSYAVGGCGVNCAIILMPHECLLRLALAWAWQWKLLFFFASFRLEATWFVRSCGRENLSSMWFGYGKMRRATQHQMVSWIFAYLCLRQYGQHRSSWGRLHGTVSTWLLMAWFGIQSLLLCLSNGL